MQTSVAIDLPSIDIPSKGLPSKGLPSKGLPSSKQRKHELTSQDFDKLSEKKNKDYDKKVIQFAIILVLTASYFFVELIYGIRISSLGLISDSIHMLSDIIAVIIAFFSYKASNWPNTAHASFGAKRMQVVGGYINCIMLVTLAFTMITSAIERLISGDVEGNLEENDTLLIIKA